MVFTQTEQDIITELRYAPNQQLSYSELSSHVDFEPNGVQLTGTEQENRSDVLRILDYNQVLDRIEEDGEMYARLNPDYLD